MADDMRTLHNRNVTSLSGRRGMLALSLATLALLGLPMRAHAQTERQPFSPAEIERGQVFEFHLNHIVQTTTPFELMRTRWVDVAARSGAALHA